MNITIAGASGFIGRNLLDSIHSDIHIKALSRSNKDKKTENITWFKADLFSYQSTNKALQNTDIAIYLVHSMIPSSRLFQGNFQDTDLLIADNFARACKKNNVKQIIYLGGLIPEQNISKHLASRMEVEEVLRSTDIPLTILRTGMVVGDGGSSFEILKNLVFNLPGMILPKWALSDTQVIYLDDLIRIINVSIDNPKFFNQTIDVVTGEKLNYKDLITQTSKRFKKKKLLIPVPINYTGFSKLWVMIFGETDYALVSPLIDSLLCDLPNSKVSPLIDDLVEHKTYMDMLKKIKSGKIKKKKRKAVFSGNTVRSIQRLENPKHLSNVQLSNEYVSWLPTKMKFIINAEKREDFIEFKFLNFVLLQLRILDSDGQTDRVKFGIDGGLLSKGSGQNGWLEFRKVAGTKYSIVSINEFKPSLPWFIYKFTQAPIHEFVMKSFGEYLSESAKLT